VARGQRGEIGALLRSFSEHQLDTRRLDGSAVFFSNGHLQLLRAPRADADEGKSHRRGDDHIRGHRRQRSPAYLFRFLSFVFLVSVLSVAWRRGYPIRSGLSGGSGATFLHYAVSLLVRVLHLCPGGAITRSGFGAAWAGDVVIPVRASWVRRLAVLGARGTQTNGTYISRLGLVLTHRPVRQKKRPS